MTNGITVITIYGKAGCGKSTILAHLISDVHVNRELMTLRTRLPMKSIPPPQPISFMPDISDYSYAVLAPTHAAVANIRSMVSRYVNVDTSRFGTIHSFFCIGPNGEHKHLEPNRITPDIVFIDEFGMIDRTLFEWCYGELKGHGTRYVVLCGDVMQLPAVYKDPQSISFKDLRKWTDRWIQAKKDVKGDVKCVVTSDVKDDVKSAITSDVKVETSMVSQRHVEIDCPPPTPLPSMMNGSTLLFQPKRRRGGMSSDGSSRSQSSAFDVNGAVTSTVKDDVKDVVTSTVKDDVKDVVTSTVKDDVKDVVTSHSHIIPILPVDVIEHIHLNVFGTSIVQHGRFCHLDANRRSNPHVRSILNHIYCRDEQFNYPFIDYTKAVDLILDDYILIAPTYRILQEIYDALSMRWLKNKSIAPYLRHIEQTPLTTSGYTHLHIYNGMTLVIDSTNPRKQYINGEEVIFNDLVDGVMKCRRCDGTELMLCPISPDGNNTNTDFGYYPVTPANLLTVHKSQGRTIDKVIVVIDDMFELSMMYTALTRAKSDIKLCTNRKSNAERLKMLFKSAKVESFKDLDLLASKCVKGKRKVDMSELIKRGDMIGERAKMLKGLMVEIRKEGVEEKMKAKVGKVRQQRKSKREVNEIEPVKHHMDVFGYSPEWNTDDERLKVGTLKSPYASGTLMPTMMVRKQVVSQSTPQQSSSTSPQQSTPQQSTPQQSSSTSPQQSTPQQSSSTSPQQSSPQQSSSTSPWQSSLMGPSQWSKPITMSIPITSTSLTTPPSYITPTTHWRSIITAPSLVTSHTDTPVIPHIDRDITLDAFRMSSSPNAPPSISQPTRTCY